MTRLDPRLWRWLGAGLLLATGGLAFWFLTRPELHRAPGGPTAPEKKKEMRYVPAPPAPPPKPAPPTRPPITTNVHRLKRPLSCLGCHASEEGPELSDGSARATCYRCHRKAHLGDSHPENLPLSPAMQTSLPLEAGRIMVCGTCHDAHGTGSMLRAKNPVDLCKDCHRGY